MVNCRLYACTQGSVRDRRVALKSPKSFRHHSSGHYRFISILFSVNKSSWKFDRSVGIVLIIRLMLTRDISAPPDLDVRYVLLLQAVYCVFPSRASRLSAERQVDLTHLKYTGLGARFWYRLVGPFTWESEHASMSPR